MTEWWGSVYRGVVGGVGGVWVNTRGGVEVHLEGRRAPGADCTVIALAPVAPQKKQAVTADARFTQQYKLQMWRYMRDPDQIKLSINADRSGMKETSGGEGKERKEKEKDT
ncbi:hypothetical protein EYF80_052129 [Liparis tanakae]|uniref:Uncharacterized protein n=1 Tax=Liparis tanakae TaxID=230148 RepID=A0A4Z2F8Z3_9TELE|nr:hypothetical protein EYF80_052129 [Liparis tanakae]